MKIDSENCKIFKLKPFNDFRGKYLESFNFKKYFKLVTKIKFVQDDFSPGNSKKCSYTGIFK